MSDPPDPRPAPSASPAPLDMARDLRPSVAGVRTSGGWWIVGGMTLLGVFVFLWLSSQRTVAPATVRADPPIAAAATSDHAAPAELLALEAAARGLAPVPQPAPAPAPPPVPMFEPLPPPFPSAIAPLPQPPETGPTFDPTPGGRTPVLVVDIGSSPTPGIGPGKGAAAEANRVAQNADEQFAARAEAAPAERSRAVMLRDTGSIVAQGTVIPAVLETALNSDLPGFTRAVISRDVRSFDGRTVLVPRGSRLIGQYRSAQALGASRAFVIWTRILRPDGASIQIGSSGTDELGRAGLAGKVDRHFLERFSGSILLSVVNAGLTAAAGPPSAQIVIGSSQDASSIASSASLPQSISPTIRVAQGTPIRIFVARDLDFSSVGAASP